MLLGDLVEVWLGEEHLEADARSMSAGLPLAAQELLGLRQQLLLQARLIRARFEARGMSGVGGIPAWCCSRG